MIQQSVLGRSADRVGRRLGQLLVRVVWLHEVVGGRNWWLVVVLGEVAVKLRF